MADIAIEPFVKHALENRINIDTSQAVVIDVFRGFFHDLPIEDRPEVRWFMYGKEIFFDKDVKSHEWGSDERCQVWERALSKVL